MPPRLRRATAVASDQESAAIKLERSRRKAYSPADTDEIGSEWDSAHCFAIGGGRRIVADAMICLTCRHAVALDGQGP